MPSCLLSSVSPCQCHYIMFTLSPVASAIASPCQCHCVMCHLAFCHQCQYVSVAKSCAILPTVISVTMSVSLHNVHIVSCCQRHCITMSMSLRHVSPCLLSSVSPCQCHYIMFTLSPVASAIASPCQCHCVMCHLAFYHQCHRVTMCSSGTASSRTPTSWPQCLLSLLLSSFLRLVSRHAPNGLLASDWSNRQKSEDSDFKILE